MKRRYAFQQHPQAIRAVDTFNAAHPCGTRVIVDRDKKVPRSGRTKSLAFLKDGIAAVRVEFFAGIGGTFPVSRVSKAEEAVAS